MEILTVDEFFQKYKIVYVAEEEHYQRIQGRPGRPSKSRLEVTSIAEIPADDEHCRRVIFKGTDARILDMKEAPAMNMRDLSLTAQEAHARFAVDTRQAGEARRPLYTCNDHYATQVSSEHYVEPRVVEEVTRVFECVHGATDPTPRPVEEASGGGGGMKLPADVEAWETYRNIRRYAATRTLRWKIAVVPRTSEDIVPRFLDETYFHCQEQLDAQAQAQAYMYYYQPQPRW